MKNGKRLDFITGTSRSGQKRIRVIQFSDELEGWVEVATVRMRKPIFPNQIKMDELLQTLLDQFKEKTNE